MWRFFELFMTCKKWAECNSIESIQIVVACKKWIKHNSIEVEVLKRDYSTASVKEIARKQKQLVRTREAKMNSPTLNVYKKGFAGSLWSLTVY